MEWLAYISVKWVLVSVAVLLLVRQALHRGRKRYPDLLVFREFLDAGLVAIVIVFLMIRPFLFQAYFIPSESMNPTLTQSDRVLVNKFIYRFGRPQRGDVIVFRPPEGRVPEQKDYIKRVIGLPGDLVEVVPKTLRVDGKTLLRFTSHAASEMMTGNYDPKREIGFTYSLNGGSTHFEKESGQAVITNGREYDLRVAICRRSDRVRFTPNEVFVNEQPVLSIVFGPVRRTSHDLTQWGGDPSLHGDLYTVNGNPRLILVRGRKLEFDEGHVLVNGLRLTEPYVAEDPLYALPPLKVPAGEYFVLGDNRNYSFDSHAWGTLEFRRIIGRADVLFWPFERRGLIRHW
jgi:signal peptidase I